MKINPINRFFNKAHHFGPIAAMWGVTSLFVGGAYPALVIKQNNDEQAAKKEVQIKDPARYERLVPADTVHDFFRNDGVFWSQEAKEMNDSLKMDSIIQKAYFEGAQMVRDSIANANKE
ncbi:MAG: hypothetical protein NC408_03150 [Candidatus Gastranaerophilales bacterium]|nr:hypothetical protein [Candidatus Gastranaerophilales bacterium]MCM1073966.1 hypothetical protein [Bacteroides sp.]